MVNSRSSEIVQNIFVVQLVNGRLAQCCELMNGSILVITTESVGVFRSKQAITDPLNTGFVNSLSLVLPEPKDEAQFILEVASGCISLISGHVLLLLPNQITMFNNKEDALYGKHAIGTLKYM